MTESSFDSMNPLERGSILESDLHNADLPRVPAEHAVDDGQVGTVDVAKNQAGAVGQSAADAGQHVAGVAQDQAKNVVAEAGTQAKDLIAQARTELTAQAGTQQQRLAAGLHSLGDELHSMTQHPQDGAGVATDLARQGANKSHDIASWLEQREPGHLAQELQSFARQRPAAFLLAGRLTRGVKDSSNGVADDGTAGTGAGL